MSSIQKLQLDNMFNNNMVLQRNEEIFICGIGTDGEEIKLDFCKQVKSTYVLNGK